MDEKTKSSAIITNDGAPDDRIIPFQLESSGVRGRVIRLGVAVNTILSQHDYPEPVSKLLGEAVTLATMLGGALKLDGKFILQTQSDGPVSFLVVHYTSPGYLRGYASYSRDDLAKLANGRATQHALFGKGHLAMTIDPGGDMDRYQGIVALEGTLTDVAHEYFAQSEQIPTFIRMAVARHYVANPEGGGHWRWRAGGLMLQKLTQEGGRPVGDEMLPPTVSGDPDDNEGWLRGQVLAATVEDHELLDPNLPVERLLYRLFHEETVRVYDAIAVEAKCNCSRDAVDHMLTRFSPGELSGMADGNTITVKCEFCNTDYRFEAEKYLQELA